MSKSWRLHGLSTLLNHYGERGHPYNALVAPIYQTSTFGFTDVDSGAAIFRGELPGYIYTRLSNPNSEQFARKVALLEGLDLLRARPGVEVDQVVAGKAFASGMAAITSAILARVRAGETLLAQESIYSSTFNFLDEIAPRAGIQVVWVKDTSATGWEEAFRAHPQAVLAYAESPANPTMLVVDLARVAEIAHQHGAWLMVDNTFATPYCQRPLALGADVVAHSATKYLSGHALLVGGIIASRHPDFIQGDLQFIRKTLGSTGGPFDAWLANMGLKTFELRMQCHCENAMAIARYLQRHPKVEAVYYPGLESHPGHAIAEKQMHTYGGMISFELKGGLEAGRILMDNVQVIRLAVSLGSVESLIQHPASMTHSVVPEQERLKVGITDGLVRFSVGIENLEDILADLEQGLEKV
ncbi:MAG: aminotransferase class I/II-fold pyridoxal phosphate-dependent enzyme [Anaerolineales bacterium]|jgi:methionine-gamma-lyase